MSDQSINAPSNMPNASKIAVWYFGTDALLEGEALCFNADYGTATDADGNRSSIVERPTITNANNFAGVVVQPKEANAAGATTPDLVELYIPGSVCNVYTLVDTVINVGAITALSNTADAGQFYTGGLPGRGTATPLQTVTAGSGSLCLAKLQDGPESGLVQHFPLTTASGGATSVGAFGTVRFTGTADLDADVTFTVADGTYVGQRYLILMAGTPAADDVVVTVTTGIQNVDANTALATAEFDAAGDSLLLEWTGVAWQCQAWTGVTIA